MVLKPIPEKRFINHPFGMWEPGWFLLTCGDFASNHFNCMTISWGSTGIIWGRPFIMVVVRPQRYTYQFMEQYTSFTVCAFSRQYHRALDILGTKSGRDTNKIAESGLTPCASEKVVSPCFVEAELVLECQKIYWGDFDPSHFLDPDIIQNYPINDFHRCYFGQIMALRGVGKYGGE